jgi:tripartite-type tricarboxylate transporter receptor subunit TctC
MSKATILVLATASLPLAPKAQPYPAKPVRILVGFTPGAGMDIALRLLAPKMGETLGQQIVVDNRPGAGGNLASEAVARAPADGYTLLTNGAPAAISQTLYPKLGYDLLRDLEAVVLIASVPQLLVVHPSLPAKTVRELVAIGKRAGNELNYASTGSGSTPHLSSEMLKLRSGMRAQHVPYRGSPPALTDLVAGNVSFMFANLLSVVPHVKQRRLRAIAISSARRHAIAPQIPAVAETFPGFESGSWYAIYAPSGTPREATARVHDAVARALQTPAVREKLLAMGAQPLGGTSQDAARFTRAEVAKWGNVVKASGAKVQ